MGVAPGGRGAISTESPDAAVAAATEATATGAGAGTRDIQAQGVLISTILTW